MTPGVRNLRTALQNSRQMPTAQLLSETLTPAQVQHLMKDWRLWARWDQLPPQPESWQSWLILGGRGAGKTRAGAEWLRARALGLWGQKAERLAIIGPSLQEARAVMIEGQSGLLSCHA